jgi:4-hydroxybenzoate polyprenyltransferase
VDGQVLSGRSKLVAYANFVKVAHTAFALPFTVVGIAAASLVRPLSLRVAGLAIVAFAAARFAAMGFNRIADLRYDARNPRTASRELVTGRLTLFEASVAVALAATLFVGASALLNPLCLALSPLALAWIMVYSLTKRFTSLSHFWLGLGLGIAPVGGYLAVTGAWSDPWWLLLLIGAGVTAWVAGFDIIYSLQDESFDREHGLRSLAVSLGPPGALLVARVLHSLAAPAILLFGVAAGFGAPFALGLAAGATVLLWEHAIVRPDDYQRLDTAFFKLNALVSAVIMLGAVVDATL